MNNINAQEGINSCLNELERIHHIIEGIGSTSHPVPYLTKYAIIKTCGTVEFCFKTIIADIGVDGQSPQTKNFIDKMFRNSSMNPNKTNIIKSLNYFDEEWKQRFKNELRTLENKQRILDSLQSLNDARNTFAHGGNPSATFENIRTYFNDTIKILEIIDRVVSTNNYSI